MSSDDLRTLALSEIDLYSLLSLDPLPAPSDSEIRKAYRRSALKYHPDKQRDAPDIDAVVAKFHLLQSAQDILLDAELRGIYDNARVARREKAERSQKLGENRRRMKEDLERRESGFKKRMRDEEDEEDLKRREMARLAEEGARVQREMMERRAAERESVIDVNAEKQVDGEKLQTEVGEMDRAVKVRWRRQGFGEDLDKDRIIKLFSRYGDIDSVVILKDKKRKLEDAKGKVMVATAVIVYKSIAAAHATVDEGIDKLMTDFDTVESIYWAKNEEPHIISNLSTPHRGAKSNGDTPINTPSMDEITQIRLRMASRRQQDLRDAESNSGPGLRKVPSFASFTTANTPQKPIPSSSTINTPNGNGSPALELLQRRKEQEVERRRLEAQIRQEEEAEEKVNSNDS